MNPESTVSNYEYNFCLSQVMIYLKDLNKYHFICFQNLHASIPSHRNQTCRVFIVIIEF